MIKGNLSVFRAEPDFLGTGLKVEVCFGRHLSGGICGREDFDADFRGGFKRNLAFYQSETFLGVLTDIGSTAPIKGGDGAFGESETFQVLLQQSGYISLAIAVTTGSRRPHKNLAVRVGLDFAMDSSEVRIGTDLLPTPSVECELLFARGCFDDQLHG